MNTRLSIIILFLFQCFLSSGQIDTIIWQNCLGTDKGYNYTHSVEKFNNGYLFGIDLRKDGPGIEQYHGSADAWIVKCDKSGNQIWNRCYGGSKGDVNEKIININETSYYLLNWTDSDDGDVQNGRPGNFWVVKINLSGDILWENSYGGTQNGEEVRDAILMPDKGLLMMGRITSAGGDVSTFYGQTDIWFCRIDSNGAILWEKTFGNQGMDNALKIKLTSYNTVVMIGGHPAPGGMIDCPFHEGDGTVCDVWIIEMDLKGKMLNQWCYGGSKDDLGCDIIEVDSGFVFAAGTTSLDGDVTGFHGYSWTYRYDYWITKIDHFGNIIWQKCLGGTKNEWPVFLTGTSDGGIIVIGDTFSNDGDVMGNHSSYGISGTPDIWVLKLTADGAIDWEHCFGGEGEERFWGIHTVLKVDDYNYVIGANSEVADGDVTCDLFPNSGTSNAWLFEIKDCSYYLPSPPVIQSGPDTLCTIAEPETLYSIDSVQWASGYEWKIEPVSSGSILSDSNFCQVTWDPLFEGQVSLQARSFNDCGYSAWSEPHNTQVYTCMGVQEPKYGGTFILAYPNPANNILNIQLEPMTDYTGSELSIYDLQGKAVLSLQLNSAKTSVSIKDIKPGIYFVRVKCRDAVLVQKLVKF